jgi:SAM-dependent methyltransferase
MVRAHFPRARTMVDVGCGTGFVLAGLREALPGLRLTGGEPSADHLALARRRLPHVELIELDILEPQRRAFDVVGAFDVLEHIADDDRALRGLFDATAPGGGSILLVPQHAWLWSRTDVYARHIRRYSRRELVSKLERTGFRVTLATSFVSALLPAMLAVRMLPRGGAASYELESELVPPVAVNRLLEKILDGERLLIERGVSLGVGGSLLVVARREPVRPQRR